MKAHLIAGAALAALASASTVIAQQVASTDPTSVQAGTYKADPNHTQVGFSVSHFGFSNFSGQIGGTTGTLVLDPARIAAAKLDVSIPVASIQTPVGKLDEVLKGAQWLDAGQFPQATFTSTRVTPTGKASATIAGNLTLHGVTQPVMLTARFVGAGTNPLDKAYTVGFEATGTIQRSAFGVKTYVPLVGDAVTLRIAGSFEKQG